MDRESADTLLHAENLATPAFIVDACRLRDNASALRRLVRDESSRLLFALKSFSSVPGLGVIADQVDGFAASSLNEVRLARRVAFGSGQTVHVTAPGLHPDEVEPICELADFISFNSLSQWARFGAVARERVACGLRVNPGLSFVDDPRYDPCREHSKLGVPIDRVSKLMEEGSALLDGISGLHFHSNCDSTDLAPLLATVEHLVARMGPRLDRFDWINLGGGYLFDGASDAGVLPVVKRRLQERGIGRLYFEPGAAITRSGGCIVSTVVDLFDSNGKRIAVLDTSVNHMPEVFEYQFRPGVWGDSTEGGHAYLLAGSACLAGDLFGDYRFAEPLAVGSRILFPDRGAYTMVKANMFNGINLPTLYLLEEGGELRQVRRYGFEDYLSLCGVNNAQDIR